MIPLILPSRNDKITEMENKSVLMAVGDRVAVAVSWIESYYKKVAPGVLVAMERSCVLIAVVVL